MTLQIKNLRKEFGNHVAVDDLSFSLEKGQVLGLLGRNGAGKTTTIKMILDLLTPTKGEITWNGKKLSASGVTIGYLPEERGLYTKSKVIDQLRYFGKLEGMSTSEVNKAIDYWLDRLEITEYKQKKAGELSKGNQQKIQLVVTLLHNPELIILDEPFSGLDPVNVNMLGEVIKEEIEKGKTIIFSSHRMDQVEAFSKQVYILKQGKPVIEGELKEIKQQYGFRNLVLDASQEIEKYLQQTGIDFEKKSSSLLVKVKSEKEALEILNGLTSENIQLQQFQMIEPTLQEIFIERAG